LSEVASPAARMNSLSVHVPVCGNIASLVYLVRVYIRQRASIAPGVRATLWGLAALSSCYFGDSPLPNHLSGSAHSKVKTALQYDPQCVSQTVVLAFIGW
jgi:hypothetical protein